MPHPVRLAPQILATTALLAWGLVPAELASGTPLRVREVLRNDLPSRPDYDRMERGYYEQILAPGRRLDAPTQAAQAGSAAVKHGRLTLPVADVREFVLRPGLVFDPGRRIPWSTNTHGMRDRPYALVKPPGTLRIALVGDSIAAGWGVGDGEGFEPRLERSLDAQSRASGGPAVEILNFAVPGHSPGQRWSHFAEVGWAFTPDLVVYEATTADPGWDERRLRVLLERGVGFDAPVYRDVLASVGLGPGLTSDDYKERLRPLRWELLAGIYQAAVADCQSRGVLAVWVLIPRVGKPIDPADRRRMIDLAHASGFATVIDACDSYDGADASTLAVAPDDYHPNAIGHARIAARLEPALKAALPSPVGRADANPGAQPR